jgi:hypothetical protein
MVKESVTGADKIVREEDISFASPNLSKCRSSGHGPST